MALLTRIKQFYLPQHLPLLPGHSAVIPQPQCITALWPVLISRPTEGRRLSWTGWLVT